MDRLLEEAVLMHHPDLHQLKVFAFHAWQGQVGGSSLKVVRARAFVQAFKSNKPCLDCHICYPFYILDFDHVRGPKINDISTMVAKGRSIFHIEQEIAKCDLICANCHRHRSFIRTTSPKSIV